MHGKFIISIPLVSSNEGAYSTKREERIKSQIESLQINKIDNETIDLVRSYLEKLNPYCYPYNDTVGFAKIYIDTTDILVNYIFNGDGRKAFNRFRENFRINAKKFYENIYCRNVGNFKNLMNSDIAIAMTEALNEIFEECKEWKITFDIEYFRDLLTSIDYKKFLFK